MKIKIKNITSEKDLKFSFAIRRKVFVEEQNVPEDIEWDKFEYKCNHVLVENFGNPVGTARWRKTQRGIKLERFAVLKEFRSCGIGGQLVKFILKELKGENNIYLHAQDHVIGFYERLHFVGVGDIFYEAGIAHLKMVYNQK